MKQRRDRCCYCFCGRRRGAPLVLFFVVLLLVDYTTSQNYHGRRMPGLDRLAEEKGRPVTVGEYLARLYIDRHKQKQPTQNEDPAASSSSTSTNRFRQTLFSGRKTKERRLEQQERAAAAAGASAVASAESKVQNSAPLPSSSSPSIEDSVVESGVTTSMPVIESGEESTQKDPLAVVMNAKTFLANIASRQWYQRLVQIVLYKPPVGIVSIWLAYRLFQSILLWSWSWSPSQQQPPDQQQQQRSRTSTHGKNRRYYTSKAWDLDTLDGQYVTAGGVQPVRQQLCLSALFVLLNKQQQEQQHQEDNLTNHTNNAVSLLVEALKVTYQPQSSRLVFLNQLLFPLSRLDLDYMHSISNNKNHDSDSSDNKELVAVLQVAYWTCQVRLMDALLRVLRNRLLQTCLRLARTQEHWKRRLQGLEKKRRRQQWWRGDYNLTGSGSSSGFTRRIWGWRWWPGRVAETMMEGDRWRLACAQAIYKAEVTKLGQVLKLLLEQPVDLEESHLIPSAKASESDHHPSSIDYRNTTAASHQRDFLFSRYSFRWVADGKGHLSVRRLDRPPGLGVSSAAAPPFVFQVLQDDADAIARRAQAWIQSSRQTICRVLKESLETTVDRNESEFQQVERAWCMDDVGTANDATTSTRTSSDISKKDPEKVVQAWRKVMEYCDSLPSWRRVGEGRSIRLFDTALVGWTRRVDFLGLPSSIVYYRLAHYVHGKMEPYLPSLLTDMVEIYHKVLEILLQRVWIPLQGIVMDIMNQGKGMMSAFSLQDEQLSLDRMLHDLGLGDGTPDQRKLGLQQATEQYENILHSSLFSNLVRGRLVRLMLIQVQQLKVGLLSALDTIDVLMQGNRIHFYILAAIPSLAIAYYSTRLFLRVLYNIRARDVRPVTFAHADMANYLEAIENILLTSDTARSKKGPAAVDRRSLLSISDTPEVRLDAFELGEILLYMHRYLLLLDFGSPPFPSSECDQIHEKLRDLLNHPGLRLQGGGNDLLNDQHLMSWLGTMQRKHQGLLQNLY